MKLNEMDFKVREAKRLMRLKSISNLVSNMLTPRVAECINPCEIEANTNSTVQLKERLETP